MRKTPIYLCLQQKKMTAPVWLIALMMVALARASAKEVVQTYPCHFTDVMGINQRTTHVYTCTNLPPQYVMNGGATTRPGPHAIETTALVDVGRGYSNTSPKGVLYVLR